ncbi:hypothetical protein [Streptomyces sp. NPDC047046]|uniref:hypothetical protein n=1 Tax=Streptomyces sp. NPDC047046 TaxID=3155378 RepID=UPI0033C374FD
MDRLTNGARRVLCAAVVVLALPLAGGCSLETDKSSDDYPHLISGRMADAPLKTVLADNALRLPASASRVRYSAGKFADGYPFSLWLDLPCADEASFAAAQYSKPAPGTDMAGAESDAEDEGYVLAKGRPYARSGTEDRATIRALVFGAKGTGSCKVFVSSFP